MDYQWVKIDSFNILNDDSAYKEEHFLNQLEPNNEYIITLCQTEDYGGYDPIVHELSNKLRVRTVVQRYFENPFSFSNNIPSTCGQCNSFWIDCAPLSNFDTLFGNSNGDEKLIRLFWSLNGLVHRYFGEIKCTIYENGTLLRDKEEIENCMGLTLNLSNIDPVSGEYKISMKIICGDHYSKSIESDLSHFIIDKKSIDLLFPQSNQSAKENESKNCDDTDASAANTDINVPPKESKNKRKNKKKNNNCNDNSNSNDSKQNVCYMSVFVLLFLMCLLGKCLHRI